MFHFGSSLAKAGPLVTQLASRTALGRRVLQPRSELFSSHCRCWGFCAIPSRTFASSNHGHRPFKRKMAADMDPGWMRDDGRVIDFSIGQPSSDLLPARMLSEALQDMVGRVEAGTFDVRNMLQYADNRGSQPFRDRLAEMLTKYHGTPVSADTVFTTNGSSSGLELCCACLTQPGDVVLVEEPTYFLAMMIFRDHKLRTVAVDTDDEGLVPSSLEKALKSHPDARFLYTIPAYGNPTTVTLSHERREAIAAICQGYNIPIVSDDVYQLLSFPSETEKLPPPFPHYTDLAISLGSFSKILGPGMRLGWIQTSPERVLDMAKRGYITSGGGLNPVASSMVVSLMDSGNIDTYLHHVRKVLGARKDTLVEALGQHLPANSVVHSNDGGYFVWVQVPGVDLSGDRAATARDKYDVFYTSGNRCSSQAQFTDHMRLCFAYYDEVKLREGARRLGEFVKAIGGESAAK
eukprot:comp22805_c0_seq1/m.35783 comp22805_c0_seq1/g.35783  ORF comp22805_c0_seq1/g.35783 comp22805_c0_seq1/m.35783 type:complete len:463 (-) comp22805_c0_seq1:119-1507(-)